MPLALTGWEPPPRENEAACVASPDSRDTLKSGPVASERRELPEGSDGGVTAEAAMIVTLILDLQHANQARRGRYHYDVVPLVDSLFVYWCL